MINYYNVPVYMYVVVTANIYISSVKCAVRANERNLLVDHICLRDLSYMSERFIIHALFFLMGDVRQ